MSENARRIKGKKRKDQGIAIQEDALEAGWAESKKIEPREERPEELEWPMSHLPEGAQESSLKELTALLIEDPRGWALLSGVERGAAGLEKYRARNDHHEAAAAFSFCLNGITWTFFEDPSDGYRSSMRAIARQEGNRCQEKFEPIALKPVMIQYVDETKQELSLAEALEVWASGQWGPSMLELRSPESGAWALAAGTSHSDDYYPSFVGGHSPEELSKASLLGIAQLLELEKELEKSPTKKKTVGTAIKTPRI